MKKFLPFLMVSTMLFSCGGTNNPGGNGGDEPPIDQPHTIFNSITDLINNIKTDTKQKESQSGKSYNRKLEMFEKTIFTDDTTVIEETATSYESNLAFYSTGKQSISKINSEFEENNTEVVKNYEVLKRQADTTYYEVLDYVEPEFDVDNVATKTEIDHANQEEISQKMSLNVTSYIITYFDNYIANKVVAGYDEIAPDLDENDNPTYKFSRTWEDLYDGEKYLSICSFEIKLDAYGYLTSFEFFFKEEWVASAPTTPNVLLQSVKDSIQVTNGTKDNYFEDIIDPTEYFLTDFEPEIKWFDGVDYTLFDAENNQVPVGMYLKAGASSYTPSKAVDAQFEIVNSANQEIVQVTNYEDGTSIAKALSTGKTTLTVRSTSGVIKTIDVEIVNPKLNKIEVNIYASHKYKGRTESIYIYKTPSNNLDTLKVEASENITITQDENGYYSAQFLEAGEAWIKVSSIENPEISQTLSFVIEEEFTKEEVKDNIVGTWTGTLPANTVELIEDAIKFEFTDTVSEEQPTHKEGSFTIVKSGHGFTFETGKKYDFKYYVDDTWYRDDQVRVVIGEIKFRSALGFEYIYGDNEAIFELNKKDARVTLRIADPNYFGYTLTSQCTKINR